MLEFMQKKGALNEMGKSRQKHALSPGPSNIICSSSDSKAVKNFKKAGQTLSNGHCVEVTQSEIQSSLKARRSGQSVGEELINSVMERREVGTENQRCMRWARGSFSVSKTVEWWQGQFLNCNKTKKLGRKRISQSEIGYVCSWSTLGGGGDLLLSKALQGWSKMISRSPQLFITQSHHKCKGHKLQKLVIFNNDQNGMLKLSSENDIRCGQKIDEKHEENQK